MNMRCFGKFYSLLSRFDNKPQKTFLKTWAKNLGLAERLVFPSKKYDGRIFFWKWQNPKNGKKSMIKVLLLDYFCSSEEPPAANA